MKLLTITLLILFTTIINAAGGDGTSGAPEQVVSVTVIDAKTDLVCFKKNNSSDIECVIVNN